MHIHVLIHDTRHGLAFFGYAGKHILKQFGEFKDIKARFSGVVYPGETLVTHMWKEGDKVIFGESFVYKSSIANTFFSHEGERTRLALFVCCCCYFDWERQIKIVDK